MSIGSIGKILFRVGRNYKHLIFNSKYQSTLEETLKKSMSANKNTGKSQFSGFGKQVKDSFKAAEKATQNESIRDGFKNTWNGIKNYRTKGKGWWKNTKSLGKALGRAFPMVMGAFMLLSEIPNIVTTIKDKGLVAGLLEGVKGLGKLGVGMSAGAIGAAICAPIIPPIGSVIGGIIGWTAGDWLFGKIFGKSYSEKKAEEAANQEEQLAKLQQLQQQQTGINPQFTGYPQYATTNVNPSYAYMSDPQVMQLYNQLYGSQGSYKDDVMYNPLNLMG